MSPERVAGEVGSSSAGRLLRRSRIELSPAWPVRLACSSRSPCFAWLGGRSRSPRWPRSRRSYCLIPGRIDTFFLERLGKLTLPLAAAAAAATILAGGALLGIFAGRSIRALGGRFYVGAMYLLLWAGWSLLYRPGPYSNESQPLPFFCKYHVGAGMQGAFLPA